MEILKALVLSTVHIRPDTADWLDGKPTTVWQVTPTVERLPFTVWRSEYGYFIAVSHILDSRAGDLTATDDLLACLGAASAAGCEWLRLDGDGPEMDGLPDYSELWEGR
jgi:hypothetical protein